MTMDWLPIDLLWRNALAVIPLAIIVALICRFVPCRPSTRHSLWLVVLIVLVAAPFLPSVPLPGVPGVPGVPAVMGSGLAQEPRAPAPLELAPALAAADATSEPLGTIHRFQRPLPVDQLVRGEAARPSPPPAPRRSSPRILNPTSDASLPQTRARPVTPWRLVPPHTARSVPGEAATRAPRQESAPVDARPHEAATAPAEPVSAAAPPLTAQPPGVPDEWGQWIAQLGAIRNAVANLPPVPVGVWAAGCALLLLLGAIRIRRSHRLIHRGRSAPPSVTRMVAAAARDLGLRRAPTTLMVDARVSPLLWCGRRTCLVLPQRLWEQLDDVGRRAVIYHELAHLRRRDHWVCRAEMFVGWLYWWHPVVWWIRRRLHEEADACCDVWVTSLMPLGRRAYAQALLETRKYLSGRPIGPSAVPSVGLGVSTSRTKRFARRLTMVMTGQMSPRLSVRGLSLAGILAFGGYLATPLWACPPSPKDVTKPEKVAKANKRFKGVIVGFPATAPVAPSVPAAPAAPFSPGDARTTFEQFMGDRGDRADQSLEERIEALERAIQRLHQQLRRVRGRGVGIGPQGAVISPGIRAPFARNDVPAPSEAALQAYSAIAAARTLGSAPGYDQVVTRAYELSSGKLKAITELMVRSDVPITVQPHGDRIEVYATPAQHLVFGAFCLLIDGDDEQRDEAYVLAKGKLEALTTLMARSDVPILIHEGDQDITVQGTDLDHAIFKAFVSMINPGQQTALADVYKRAAVGYLDAQARDSKARVTMRTAELRNLQSNLREQQRNMRTLLRQAQRRLDRANQCVNKANECEDEAEALEDEAEHVDRDSRRNALRARAQELRAKAEAYRRQAEAFEMESENLEEGALQVEDQAAALEDRIQEFEDRIEELREAAKDD